MKIEQKKRARRGGYEVDDMSTPMFALESQKKDAVDGLTAAQQRESLREGRKRKCVKDRRVPEWMGSWLVAARRRWVRERKDALDRTGSVEKSETKSRENATTSSRHSYSYKNNTENSREGSVGEKSEGESEQEEGGCDGGISLCC